jgi:glycosyltransferase involved in cell wall biosynthesis
VRVAFINQTGAKPGGAEESLTLLVKNLPRDIDPLMLLMEDGEFAQRFRDIGLQTQIVSVDEKLRNVTREKPSSLGALGLPRALAAFAATLGKQRVDLVYTNSVKAHLIAAPAARLRRIPAVMHLRDMVGGAGRTALRTVARTCSREQIAVSRAIDRWYGFPRSTVISNPVDLSQYASLPSRAEARRMLNLPDDDVPLIGIVGRINRWKGHDRLLRVAAAVNKQRPIRCAIVGEARFHGADFVLELHQLTADLGIADQTIFVPWLDDPRLAYAALDIHCNCSDREPFGRSIVEAAAAGVPTVAFDDGGAVDIIEDGKDGRLVPAGDLEAFANAVLGLLSGAETMQLVSDAARERSSRFAAPAHAELVAGVLRRSARRGKVISR